MACFKPKTAYQHKTRSNPKTGKSLIRFNLPNDPCSWHEWNEILVPCYWCNGCRLQRANGWAARCMHEAQMHYENSFITVTFSPENMPADNSLSIRTHQLFTKSLREKVAREYGQEFRFYMCGEYGSQFGRPHYHYLIFGFEFPDKYKFFTKRGVTLYRSPLLESVWKYGYSTVGELTMQSAGYVSRYIMDKATGDLAHQRYWDPVLQVYRLPEFNLMSRNPGIARDWFLKYKSDVFPHDRVIIEGRKYKPPKFYDRLFEAQYPDQFAAIKEKRKESALLMAADNTPERLYDKSVVLQARLSSFPRQLSNF